MIKRCRICQQFKESFEFAKGLCEFNLHSYCKPCQAVKTKQCRQLNIEKYRMKEKEYEKNNKDKIRKRKRERIRNNLKLILLNREKNKEYRNSVRGKLNRLEYERNKRKTDGKFKAIKNLRRRLLSSFQAKNWPKSGKFHEYIGCTRDELFEHIERQFKNGMSWENHGFGNDKWNLNHIIPLSSARDDQELYNLSHYLNLQPMWQPDNLRKSNKIGE